MEKKYIIDGSLFKISKILAEKEYNRWENINKEKKEKQCRNSFNSCFIGILSERAAQQYLQSEKANEIKELIMAGIQEREEQKHYNKGDIIIKSYLHSTYKAEVKGITKGSQRGQITPYHVKKYIKEKVSKVIFVEVSYNIKKGFAECIVYLDEKPKDIISWNLQENKYGVRCYTYEKYFIGEK